VNKTEIKPLALPDPYADLGLAQAATDAEIKQAYFAQVRLHPPETDPQGFKRIRAAYERLRTPEKRLETDMLRLAVWPEPSLESEWLTVGEAPTRGVDFADVIRAARALSDLGRRDFREDEQEVKL
jgi:curved DNA-binding protein CbpA